MILDKLKLFSEVLTTVDEKLGIRKFCLYLCIGAVIYGLFNFKAVVKDVIDICDQIQYEEHARKMLLRDQLMIELSPMLSELRAACGADRLMYFEYHNSKENFVGIPFKYLDLVMSNHRYGISDVSLTKTRDINSGLIADLYADLNKEYVIINTGPDDLRFLRKYPNILQIFNELTGSKLQVFVNLTGINVPIGIIVLEWYDEDNKKDWNVIKKICRDYEPRLNALIVSKSK